MQMIEHGTDSIKKIFVINIREAVLQPTHDLRQ
jgi:hypothetical protein